MTIFAGIFIVIISGILNGSYAAPLKKIRFWEWENIWLVYSFMAMIIVPAAITFIFAPELLDLYKSVSAYKILQIAFFGFCWGIGAVMFGLAIHLMGISVGFTIVIGGTAAFGSLIPYVTGHPNNFVWNDIVMGMALILTIVGIAITSNASKIRESEKVIDIKEKTLNKGSVRKGLIISILAGLFSSMLNWAFYFGQPIADLAKALPDFQTSSLIVINHSIWFIPLLAGFVPFLFYCCYLLFRERTYSLYLKSGAVNNWFYAILMALIWDGCIILYGLGASKMGELGVSLGWLILMSMTVIFGNIWGFITGEWRAASLKSKKLMYTGMIFLLMGIVVITLSKF
jgi:L-rhamnose-H+ transport protein